MLLIGSQALHVSGFLNDISIVKSDWDFIVSSEEEWESYRKSLDGVEIKLENPKSRAFYSVILKTPDNPEGVKSYYECTIAEPGSSDQMLLDYAEKNCPSPDSMHAHKILVASPEMILAIKLSHRYKKNTPFFRKTMNHIRFMRSRGVKLNPELEAISSLREKETLSYPHPNLSVNKSEFFKDDFYTVDHDSIHCAVALFDKPAYTYYMKDDSEVMTDRNKFFTMPFEIQLAGVYEETCVLALERSQIPNDFSVDANKIFLYALEKVCTSITSGWFREFAWENYHLVVKMHNDLGHDDYIKRYKKNIDMIKPFNK